MLFVYGEILVEFNEAENNIQRCYVSILLIEKLEVYDKELVLALNKAINILNNAKILYDQENYDEAMEKIVESNELCVQIIEQSNEMYLKALVNYDFMYRYFYLISRISVIIIVFFSFFLWGKLKKRIIKKIFNLIPVIKTNEN